MFYLQNRAVLYFLDGKNYSHKILFVLKNLSSVLQYKIDLKLILIFKVLGSMSIAICILL